jgi:hypothetical protein
MRFLVNLMESAKAQKYSPLASDATEDNEISPPKYRRSRLGFWSQILSYVALAFLVPYVFWMKSKLSSVESCELPSDKLFGHCRLQN